MRQFRISLLLVITFAFGCSKSPAPSAQSGLMKIEGLPVTMTVQQRATTVVTGSNGMLSITTDDITRGQVITSVIVKQGKAIFGPVSMKMGDTRSFNFGDQEYSLLLEKLNNALVGEDFATFTITKSDQVISSDSVIIGKLLDAIETTQDARFIRNGKEYTSREAANHLRSKYEASKDQVHSAQDFIDKIASISSLSGEEYEVLIPGKAPVKARDFLSQELEKLKTKP